MEALKFNTRGIWFCPIPIQKNVGAGQKERKDAGWYNGILGTSWPSNCHAIIEGTTLHCNALNHSHTYIFMNTFTCSKYMDNDWGKLTYMMSKILLVKFRDQKKCKFEMRLWDKGRSLTVFDREKVSNLWFQEEACRPKAMLRLRFRPRAKTLHLLPNNQQGKGKVGRQEHY